MPVQLFRRKENPIDTPGTCSMLLGYSLWFLSSSTVWENNNDYHEAGEHDDDDDVGATLLNMKGKKGICISVFSYVECFYIGYIF